MTHKRRHRSKLKPSQLIAPRGAWVSGVEARDCCGYEVEPRSEKARCWDMIGAARKCSTGHKDFRRMLVAIRRAMDPSAMGLSNHTFNLDLVAKFNDCHRKAEVMKVLRKAGL